MPVSLVSESLPSVPGDDPLQESVVAFSQDDNPNKMNLLMGIFCGEDGKPWVLPTVKKVARRSAYDRTQHYGYGPILGDPEFLKCGRELLFGTDDESIDERIASVQTISGTGACRMGARLLVESTAPKTVWFSDPGWKNFEWIWSAAGPKVNQRTYPYLDKENGVFDFEAMKKTFKKETKTGDVIVLQLCAHNPTGVDPSKDQWKEIIAICKSKGLFIFMDSAYHGLATENLDRDAWPVRYLAQQEVEFAVAQSFSKNFGLYGERIGIFHLVAPSVEHKKKVEGVLKHLQQSEIMTPPKNGAQIVTRILQNPELKTAWLQDLKDMRIRLWQIRRLLQKRLSMIDTNTNWDFITYQLGLFCYIELDKDVLSRLMASHIYLMRPGRMSISGLNDEKIGRIAEAITGSQLEREAEESSKNNKRRKRSK